MCSSDLAAATRAEARAMHLHGLIQLRLRKTARAQRCFQRALHLARNCGHRETEAHALAWLGQIHGNRGDSRRAVQHLRNATDIMEQVAPSSGAILIAPRLAEAYAADNDWAAATDTLQRCLDQSRSYGNRRMEMAAYRARGRLHLTFGNHPQAIADLTQAVELANQLNIPRDIQTCRRSLEQAQATIDSI